jgi:hypothetical protein
MSDQPFRPSPETPLPPALAAKVPYIQQAMDATDRAMQPPDIMLEAGRLDPNHDIYKLPTLLHKLRAFVSGDRRAYAERRTDHYLPVKHGRMVMDHLVATGDIVVAGSVDFGEEQRKDVRSTSQQKLNGHFNGLYYRRAQPQNRNVVS